MCIRDSAWIEQAQDDNPALRDYLANFRMWAEVGDEDQPFLPSL